jgi:hypothetical protein
MIRKNIDTTVLSTVGRYMNIPEEKILARSRKNDVVIARYITSCIWDHQLEFDGKDEIEKHLPIKRSCLYNAWKSLMSSYLYNKGDREWIDELFLMFTEKTFPECEQEMYDNLYKNRQGKRDQLEMGNTAYPGVKQRIEEREFLTKYFDKCKSQEKDN